MALLALVPTLGLLLYPGSGGSWVFAASMWAGVGCLFLAWRSVPRGVDPAERPAMARTAGWIVLAVLVAFGLPIILVNLGVVGFD
jgi:hypothetical protein